MNVYDDVLIRGRAVIYPADAVFPWKPNFYQLPKVVDGRVHYKHEPQVIPAPLTNYLEASHVREDS